MTTNFKTGEVKLFNAEKGFGFIKYVDPDTNESQDVFFHQAFINSCNSDGSDEPYYLRAYPKFPTVGQTVLFESNVGPKGPRCSRLVYPEEYEKAMLEIEWRQTYRVRSRTGAVNTSKLARPDSCKVETLWEGKNLAELRMNFPQKNFPIVDDVHKAFWIEILKGENWERVNEGFDPR